MDTESVYASLVSENLYTSDHLKALYMNQTSYTVDSLKKASVDEITLCLSESLHIRDGPNTSAATIFSPPFDNGDKLYISDDADVEDEVEIDYTKVTPQKELIKSATFPCSSKLQLSTNFSDGKTGGVNDTAAEIKVASSESSMTAHSRSISLPVPLVSAMKGTREKLGIPRDKRSVTWAPDVYDPPPSAPSTAVLNPKQRRRSDRKKMIDNSKKNGKSKQKKKSSSKGSSSSSSSSKDKRQVQKYSRGSNVFYKSFEGESKIVVEGFDCGSSFLKTAVTNLHFSLAEAT